uniref:Formamidopyrimidine-DNA glycosylase catalytic domain-containing protein n=1 Tax=Calcidiscus leptoporus TaxID=127549 RepID=A0A7S0NUS3_9EUKA|mmetsp:Transcript_24788/g.57786  ORF Transcript_24788/g.57786 Transcript_24788/m.57786 type:complete len:402 (+) Transcript_24788:3-1208(+)
MPELPEVEAQRRTIEAATLGKQVTLLVATEQGGGPRDGEFDDKIVGEGVTPPELAAALQDKWVLAVKRRGKQLWVELSATRGGACCGCLLLHFGMTGAVVIKGRDAPLYKKFSIDMSSWPPRFTKLELVFGDTSLAYTDPRRFGRILLRGPSPSDVPPLSELAADPLTDPLPLANFAAALRRKSAPIKAALLDQGFAFCGVGNWVADEVLYQAGVLPSAPCNRLSDAQIERTHAQVLAVCNVACAAGADASAFPPGWLFHHRWQNQTSGSMDSPLGRIHFDTVGGRTTAFVPAKQKAAEGEPPPKEAKASKKASATSKRRSSEIQGDEPTEAEAKPKAGRAAKRGKKVVAKELKTAVPATEATEATEAKPKRRRGTKQAEELKLERGAEPATARRSRVRSG